MKIERPLSGNDLDMDIIIQSMIASAIERAEEAQPITAAAVDQETLNAVETSGASFTIPVLIPEDKLSGDARKVKPGALSSRLFPLALAWQIKSSKSGHEGSVIVGRIDSAERIEGVGFGNARGVFDVGPFGREAQRLVEGEFLRGVSADLDSFEASSEREDDDELADDSKIKNKELTIESARIMGATLVTYPAFEECFIMIDKEPNLSDGDGIVADGEYEEMLDNIDADLAALAASAAPVVPPREWFNNPNLDGPTPLTVDDDGRVFGHIAAWHVDHIGLPRATKPPRSASKYAYFRTGVVRTDDGSDVQVGQLTLAGGHAPLTASTADAVKHYDDTASAAADVIAGEDQFGIWVAGALRPEVTPPQVRALRASAPSGDWRPINGRLELVAVCQVNVPGFPVARSIVAGGQIQALVAAGAAPLAELRETSQMGVVEKRLHDLEQLALRSQAEDAVKILEEFSNEVQPVKQDNTEDLEALAASAMAELDAFKTEREYNDAVAELKNLFDNR